MSDNMGKWILVTGFMVTAVLVVSEPAIPDLWYALMFICAALIIGLFGNFDNETNQPCAEGR